MLTFNQRAITSVLQGRTPTLQIREETGLTLQTIYAILKRLEERDIVIRETTNFVTTYRLNKRVFEKEMRNPKRIYLRTKPKKVYKNAQGKVISRQAWHEKNK